MTQPAFYIWTMGCQMNKADSQALASRLSSLGYSPILKPEGADIVVVNTCVVRQHAEDRATSRLASLKILKRRGNPLIALAGCMVGAGDDGLKRRFPHVDLFLKPGEFAPLLERAGERAKALPPVEEEAFSPLVTAFVPIIWGCDKFCTYCIVPLRRGRERSRPEEEIACQVKELVRRGVREVTLLGQNVDSYGRDLPHKPELADLLEKLDKVDGLLRLRFLTSHPRDMTPRLVEAVASLGKVCEYISLPVQAGDGRILEAMRRGYTVKEYLELVAAIRKRVPGVALSTDVIVGFPGETEENFHHTLDLLREVRFDTVHVAAYSPRPGTFAAQHLPDDVLAEVKQERLRRVEELQEAISREINASMVGQRVEVLVEGKKGGKAKGRTRTNKLVFFPSDTAREGELAQVEITRSGPWSLSGGAPGL